MADELRVFENQEQIDRAKTLLIQSPTANSKVIDNLYGDGTSVSILKGTYELPTVEQAEDNGEDGVIVDMAKGLGSGVKNAVLEGVQFLADFAAEKDGGLELTNPLDDPEKFGFTQADADRYKENNAEQIAAAQSRQETIKARKAAFDAQMDAAIDYGGERDTIAGNITQGITQFVAGMVGIGKFTKLKTFSTIKGGLIGGAVVDATMFDPDDANLVRMLDEQFGISNEVVTDILANDEESQWDNRLKNAATGGLIGGALDGIIIGLRFTKLKIQGRKELQETGEVSAETLEATSKLEAQIKELQEYEFNKIDLPVRGEVSDIPINQSVPTTPARVTGEGKPEIPTDIPRTSVATSTDELAQPSAADNPFSSIKPLDDLPVRGEVSELPTPPKVDTAAPEVPAAPVKAEAVTVAPKMPQPKKPPSSVVSRKALKDAAIRARSLSDDGVIQLGQVDEMGNSIGLFNYSRMDAPMDAVKVMDQIHDELGKAGILKGMGLNKTQTHDEVSRLALKELGDMVDGDPDLVRQRFAQLEAAGRDTAPRIVAGKMALQSTAREIARLTDELDVLAKGGNTDTMLERKFVDMLELHADLQASVKGMQTAAARATAAGRIQTADALSDAMLDRLQQFGGSRRVRKLVKQLKATNGDPKSTARLIRKAQERRVWGIINETWINAILSSPLTHKMNIGANAVNMLMRPAIRATGGLVTANPQQMEEGLRQYVYMIEELSESLKWITSVGLMGRDDNAVAMAMKSFYNEEGILDTASKFDFDQAGNGRSISSAGTRLQGTATGSVVDNVGKAVRLSGRSLQAEDEFFKQIIFRSRLKAKVIASSRRLTDEQLSELGYASRDDYVKGEVNNAINTKESLSEQWDTMVKTGKVADDLDAKQAYIKKNLGTYNHNSKMAQDALEEARESTFTTPLQQGTMGRGVQNLMNYHPWLRQIMPFVQTPTNILRTGFERAPILNLMMSEYRRKLFKGTPEEKAIAYGNMSFGIGTLAMAVSYAAAGKITGGGANWATERNKAKIQSASPDWQPYSINVGTEENPEWLELRRLDPHGLLFGIVGDIYEMTEYNRNDPDAEVAGLMAMAAASIGNNIMSKTYLMSLNESMNMLNGSTNGWQIQNFATNRAASMIPLSGLQYNLNQTYDPDGSMRELRTLTDKVKARIIGQNASNAVRHDWITGETVDTPDYAFGFVRRKKIDSGEHKAARIFEELRKLNHGFAPPLRKLGDIQLDSQAYQRYNELVGTTRVNKRTLSEQLDRYFQSDAYAKLTEEAESMTISSSLDPRVIQVSKIMQQYKQTAQKRLFKENPSLGKAFYKNKRINKALKDGADRKISEQIVTEFSLFDN